MRKGSIKKAIILMICRAIPKKYPLPLTLYLGHEIWFVLKCLSGADKTWMEVTVSSDLCGRSSGGWRVKVLSTHMSVCKKIYIIILYVNPLGSCKLIICPSSTCTASILLCRATWLGLVRSQDPTSSPSNLPASWDSAGGGATGSEWRRSPPADGSYYHQHIAY